uniref:non-specific serine/threonine protein kinase n=1 Tax=Amphiprion ocellaris TaxID=80972 RepID=A0A3Q1AHN8_AMPOC
MMESGNYVAKLNEFVQRKRLELRYEDVGSAGPDHIKTFTLRAVLNGKAYPDGVGKNKKEAKQNAAKNALRGLLEETGDSTEHAAEASTTPVRQTTLSSNNYVGWLNEYVSTLHPVSFIAVSKEEAAKLVYHEICGSRTTETGEEKDSNTSSQQREELNKNVSDVWNKDSSFTETNFIGIVHNYCQKTNRTCAFMEAGRSGPPHNRKFFYKLSINNKEYPVGEGKNVKEAKQNAAQLAWDALQEQSDYDSKVFIIFYFYSISNSPNTSFVSSDKLVIAFLPFISKHASPDVKPKMSIAANFPKANESSKEDLMPNFKCKTTESTKSEKTPSQSGSRFTSDFDSIEQLGEGAFGRVFKAKHKLLDMYYAIKIVRYKEKALREVKALSDLDHSNIVRYYTCWREDSEYHWDSSTDSSTASQSSSDSSTKYLYIQMELCDTRTLRVWIYEKNAQNVKKSLRDSKRREESLSIAQQLVSGVEYIHSKMLIHRDLKPANIMFGRDGEVKIGDFGLVTAENDDDAENLMERTVYKGTPSYMAPEQKSRNTYDRKVDIFALGLIYFELLWNVSTGHERVIWEDVRNQKLPEGFSHHFHQESQIIKSMLCVNPEDRPEASKLKTDMEECKRSLVMPKKIQRDSHTV